MKNLKNKYFPKEIVIDGIKSCESNDIVNKLNEYFTSMSKGLTQNKAKKKFRLMSLS